MDFFNNWTLSESEIFSLADLSSPTNPSDPSRGGWSWADQSTTTSLSGGDCILSTDGRGSSSSSRKSSEASDIDSPWGEKVVFATHNEDCDLESENQGQPLVIEKEPTHHRIQRRRIQNRNAQRNFRQRQENERRMLEEQLRIAEQQCNKLNSAVHIMRDRLKRLEAENTILRTSVCSMPWRKDST